MPLTTIGTIESATELGQLVGIFYSYALEIAGLCVFLVVVYAGFSYMFGEKLPGGSAKTIIQNAVIGLVLLYSANIILSAISCDLVGSCSSNTPSGTPASGGGATSPSSGATQPAAQQPLPTFQGQGGSFGGGGATGSF